MNMPVDVNVLIICKLSQTFDTDFFHLNLMEMLLHHQLG